MNRRELIRSAGSLAILTGLSYQPVWGRSLPAGVFTLGVAAGDPMADGFVIWTRLAPVPHEPGSGMPMAAVPVQWEVAEDERFARVVASGEAMARPELGHSVHVEVEGLLSARRYWYRFRAGGQESPVGTARSAPARGAGAERIRIGVAGCQHYEGGYFTAFRHLAEEDELDAIFHYGDYIYEHWPQRGCPKDAAGEALCVRQHDTDEIFSLGDYRRRYALYKRDPDLQAAHAAAAFLHTWDDHEIDNNWAGDIDENGTPPMAFVLRRAAAMQAWYENMPVRRAQFPIDGRVRMYRRLDYGSLVRVHLLDTRQYRTDQICAPTQTEHCRTASGDGPSHVLGAEQEAWLGRGLGGGHQWNLVAQQIMVMPFAYPKSRKAGVVNTDSWSGYPDARERLVRAIQDQKLTNVVIATGDVHKHHAGVLPSIEGDLASAPVATEYVCSSVSSGGDGSDLPSGWEGVEEQNPHTALVNDKRGYQVFDITPTTWKTSVMAVESVSIRGAPRREIATLVTEVGRPGVHTA